MILRSQLKDILLLAIFDLNINAISVKTMINMDYSYQRSRSEVSLYFVHRPKDQSYTTTKQQQQLVAKSSSKGIDFPACFFCPYVGTISDARGARPARDPVSILVLLFLWRWAAANGVCRVG